MKRLIRFMAIVLLIVGMILPTIGSSQQAMAINEASKKVMKDVPTNKIWSVHVTRKIKSNEKLQKSIYVLDKKNQKVDVDVYTSKNRKVIYIQPPYEGYEPNTTYTLVVSDTLKSENGKAVSKGLSQKFTTATKRLHLGQFEPRKNSKNEITANKAVKQVPAGKVKVLKKTSLELTGTYKKGNIIAIPPSSNYPNGAFKKITNAKKNGKKTIATVKNAPIREALSSMDISTTGKMDRDNIALSKDLTKNTFTSKYGKALKAKPLATIHYTPKDVVISLVDIGFDSGNKKFKGNLKGEGAVALTGNIVLHDIDASIDINKFQVNEASVSASPTFEFSADANAKTLEGEVEIPVADIPVPYAAVKGPFGWEIGAVVKVSLIASVEASGKISVKINKKFEIGSGLKYDDAQKEFIPSSYFKQDKMKMDELEGEANLELSAGPRVAVGLVVGEYSLAEVGLATPLNFDAYASADAVEKTACFEYDFYLSAVIDFSVLNGKYKDNTDNEDHFSNIEDRRLHIASDSTCDDLFNEKPEVPKVEDTIYKKSYKIVNTGDSPLIINTSIADNIRFEQETNKYVDAFTNTSLFSLKKGQYGYLSYRQQDTQAPTIISGQGTIESNEKEAFNVFTLLGKQALEVDNNTEQTIIVFPEGQQDKGYVASMMYNELTGHSSTMNRHLFKKVSADTIYQAKEDQLIVENPIEGTTMHVFVPNSDEIKAQPADEFAIREYVLHPGEIGDFSVKETTGYMYSMPLSVASLATSQHATFNTTQYSRSSNSSTVKKLETNTSYPTRDVQVLNDGNVIIENTGAEDIVVYGPARKISYKATTEKPFVETTLAAGQSVKVTSSVDNMLGTEIIPEGEKTATYSVTTTRANTQANTKFTNIQVGAAVKHLNIYKDGYTIVQNTSGSPIRLYGPSRYITFE